ncbi:chromosome segregation protein SMC [Pseudomonas sp. RTC3]|uniref:chromosome segregation protein SMC n=1 Tax=Pseudomonas sp. 5C2 TaxID=3048588 RepID=UPI002AB4390E|nr:chromosome segregation protein SMC [Pseudomonas sp. 5C2]MDY7563596.1 chromosome segregation protein SMC [Pseudomonas sp. 5C2]MEB0062861.1 chromosome segregation protein SMC [Pseudomonas sp. RTC3]MEB0241140.1 chromosome segregation protein SMC [Pseudomonas sp. 5C2]
MNRIEQLKDARAKLAIEMEAIKRELPPFEAALQSEDAINQGRESDVRHEISSRKIKIDSIGHQIFRLDQKLDLLETLANQESLMEGYIADMANWMADELELNAKRHSLTTRLEEIRQQTQEEMASARQAETLAASAYARAVAWGDVEGEKAASIDAQKAAKNLTTATEHHRRQLLIITALEQELATVDRHISEAQVEHQKIEDTALRLAHNALEERWNEAAQALLDVGGKLYAAANLIGRDPVSLFKLDIPEQGENSGSWRWRDLVDRGSQHRTRDLLAM